MNILTPVPGEARYFEAEEKELIIDNITLKSFLSYTTSYDIKVTENKTVVIFEKGNYNPPTGDCEAVKASFIILASICAVCVALKNFKLRRINL